MYDEFVPPVIGACNWIAYDAVHYQSSALSHSAPTYRDISNQAMFGALLVCADLRKFELVYQILTGQKKKNYKKKQAIVCCKIHMSFDHSNMLALETL